MARSLEPRRRVRRGGGRPRLLISRVGWRNGSVLSQCIWRRQYYTFSSVNFGEQMPFSSAEKLV
eukprot:Gb_14567 [translate_table: standard]